MVKLDIKQIREGILNGTYSVGGSISSSGPALRSVPATGGRPSVASKAEPAKPVTEMYADSDDSEEEQPPKAMHWECPIDITSVQDIESQEIVDSLSDPHSAPDDPSDGRKRYYKYTTKKALRNLNEMFGECVAVMEEYEANRI